MPLPTSVPPHYLPPPHLPPPHLLPPHLPPDLLALLRCSLWKHEDAGRDKDEEHGRRPVAAERQTTRADRLVQEIAHHGAERPGQDERCPEQHGSRDPGPVVRGDDQDQ